MYVYCVRVPWHGQDGHWFGLIVVYFPLPACLPPHLPPFLVTFKALFYSSRNKMHFLQDRQKKAGGTGRRSLPEHYPPTTFTRPTSLSLSFNLHAHILVDMVARFLLVQRPLFYLRCFPALLHTMLRLGRHVLPVACL